MEKKIKFSIGIPAFKEVFFKKCIQSILDQSYTEFEVIIVNDASPNDLKSIVNTFYDDRIRYFENDSNIGAEQVVFNWNKCLSHATGDFFILMGDDDLMSPDYLQTFVGLIKKYPDLNVYHCRSIIIDENDQPISLTFSWPEFENVYENILHRITEKRNQFISDFVYRKSHLDKEGGFYYQPLAWGADDLTAYRACGSKGIAHSDKPVFFYRSNSYSITSTGNSVLKMKATIHYFKWLKEFLVNNQPTDRIAKVTFDHLTRSLNKYERNRKVSELIVYLNADLWRNTLLWIKIRKKYEITFIQLMYSFFRAVNMSFSKEKGHIL